MNSPLLVTIRPVLAQFLLFCILCVVGVAQSQEGQQPVVTEANQALPEIDVQVTASIEPSDDLVVSQQIILNIEVATPIWFSGGTRIGSFEIDDVVVLRREKFSVNSVRRVGNQTWSVQLWSITLYPQTAGRFVIPEIQLDISIAKEGGQATTVSRQTKPISFSVRLPDEVQQHTKLFSAQEGAWVATTRLQVEESFDRTLTDLRVGDVVKRTIDIRSENIAAMMLPALRFVAPEGLAVYQDSAKITDRVNRGDYIASRQETVSYVIEKEGAYRLPQIDLYWWDLNTQSLRHKVLAEQIISTSGAASDAIVELRVADDNQAEPLTADFDLRILIIVLFMLILVTFWWFKRSGTRPGVLTDQQTLTDLEQEFKDQCRQKEFSQASSLFYQWFNAQLDPAEMASSEFSVRRWLRTRNTPAVLNLFDGLMAAAHSRTGKQADKNQLFESLLTQMKPMILADKRLEKGKSSIEFNLN